MSRREDSDLMLAFQRHYMGPDRDLDAALREVYEMGVQDTLASVRSGRSLRSSDRMREKAARALPFVRRIAKWKKVSPTRLITGRDYVTSRERQEAMFVLRELPGRPFSYPIIAAVFGKKDHTTVISGCRAVEARIANDPGLGARLRNLTRRIGAAA